MGIFIILFLLSLIFLVDGPTACLLIRMEGTESICPTRGLDGNPYGNERGGGQPLSDFRELRPPGKNRAGAPEMGPVFL